MPEAIRPAPAVDVADEDFWRPYAGLCSPHSLFSFAMDTFVFRLAPIGASLARRICFPAILAGLLTGCSSSSTTNVTAPSDARCAIALGGPMPVVESAGGTGRLNISINRECTWSARSEVDWIAISPASGQGDAQVDYSVAANPLFTTRRC